MQQDSIVDKKIQVIYDNYKDNIYAKNAQKEVQQTRRHALKVGATISTMAFVGNEVARLSMRSRKYWSYLHNFISNHHYFVFYSIVQIEGPKCPFLARCTILHGQVDLQ